MEEQDRPIRAAPNDADGDPDFQRPFGEVQAWLQESWRGMGEPAPWAEVEDIVRSGYERYRGAGLRASTYLATEALRHFQDHSTGGSDLPSPSGYSEQAGGGPEKPTT